jgi:hypothetical protein
METMQRIEYYLTNSNCDLPIFFSMVYRIFSAASAARKKVRSFSVWGSSCGAGDRYPNRQQSFTAAAPWWSDNSDGCGNEVQRCMKVEMVNGK